MNKTIKILVATLLASVFTYFMYFIFMFLFCTHRTRFESNEQILWLIKPQHLNEIDKTVRSSQIGRKDRYYSLIYQSNTNIKIWEFPFIGNLDIRNKLSGIRTQYEDLNSGFRETLNVGGRPEVKTKFNLNLESDFVITIDEYTKIDSLIYSKNYCGFIGILNKITLCNNKGKAQIRFDYSKLKVTSVFLLYKSTASFYLIMVDADKPFDPSIINIFNLE